MLYLAPLHHHHASFEKFPTSIGQYSINSQWRNQQWHWPETLSAMTLVSKNRNWRDVTFTPAHVTFRWHSCWPKQKWPSWLSPPTVLCLNFSSLSKLETSWGLEYARCYVTLRSCYVDQSFLAFFTCPKLGKVSSQVDSMHSRHSDIPNFHMGKKQLLYNL